MSKDQAIIHRELERQSRIWTDPVKFRRNSFLQQAYGALHRDHVRAIIINDELYLARFWISNPTPLKEGHPARYKSDNAVLLHWIVRPDADRAIHDHPWGFVSQILHGGYGEIYLTATREDTIGPEIAPPFNRGGLKYRYRQAEINQKVYATRHHAHLITAVENDTWTLVHTDPNFYDHSWGFYPPGKKWVDWKTYLGESSSGDS